MHETQPQWNESYDDRAPLLPPPPPEKCGLPPGVHRPPSPSSNDVEPSEPSGGPCVDAEGFCDARDGGDLDDAIAGRYPTHADRAGDTNTGDGAIGVIA